MEISHIKLNESEYLLRQDEWIRRFESLESNSVTAYRNVIFEKVDGRTIGFKEKEITYYLSDEKLNQMVFRIDRLEENKVYEDIKGWLNEHIDKQYEVLIQLH
ncbi:MAG: hypothetical protein KTR27_11840 [Leptolyngbyaceae cyanobacterium MAG.088]|nr:hypothetical protein [Leptolyngbyaceae cyanobacterium MAG.088]